VHATPAELHAFRRAAIAALACLALPALALAEDARAGHEHATGAAAIAGLKLDGERKWATDAPLREGMASIRRAFDADHPAIHAGTETDAQYAALADRIEGSVNGIVANCRLAPEADANLHLVVADLLHGAQLMRGGDAGRTRHDGAALVHGALDAYGRYFDDPDWPR
jgi:hypothetical protein